MRNEARMMDAKDREADLVKKINDLHEENAGLVNTIRGERKEMKALRDSVRTLLEFAGDPEEAPSQEVKEGMWKAQGVLNGLACYMPSGWDEDDGI